MEERGKCAYQRTLPKPKLEPNIAKSHHSSAVSKYTKPTGKHRSSWPAQKMTANYTFGVSGRGLWDASGTANPATDTCRGHRGATYTGADGDGWSVVWFFLSFLVEKNSMQSCD